MRPSIIEPGSVRRQSRRPFMYSSSFIRPREVKTGADRAHRLVHRKCSCRRHSFALERWIRTLIQPHPLVSWA